jgi:hypothetical protein
MTMVILALIANCFAAAIRAQTLGERQHLFDGIAGGVVDRNSADLLRKSQPIGMLVDDYNLASSLNVG